MYFDNSVICRPDLFFSARFTFLYDHDSLLTPFFCFFVLFHACCSCLYRAETASHRADIMPILGIFINQSIITLVHEFRISYNHNQCHVLFFRQSNYMCRRNVRDEIALWAEDSVPFYYYYHYNYYYGVFSLPGPYVTVRVTCGALVAHRYTYAPPRCRTLQHSRNFIPLSVSLWNDLANPVFDGVGLAWDWPMLLYWRKLLYPYYSLLIFFPFSFLSIGWYCGAGVFGLIGCTSLSALHCRSF